MAPQATNGTTPHSTPRVDAGRVSDEIAQAPIKAKKRKTPEERLQDALVRKQAIQAKIDGLKAELNENNRKARNRGLMLVGVATEQAFKNKAFSEKGLEQLLSWSKFLSEKDREAYIAFMQILRNAK